MSDTLRTETDLRAWGIRLMGSESWQDTGRLYIEYADAWQSELAAERKAREETQAMLNSEHDAHMECHRRAEAAEAQLATERKDTERLKARAEEAEAELQIAVNHCCNSYWNEGHGARVKARYGFDIDEDE